MDRSERRTSAQANIAPVRADHGAQLDPDVFTHRLLSILADEAVLVVDERTMTVKHANDEAERLFAFESGAMAGRAISSIHETQESFESFDRAVTDKVRHGERHLEISTLQRSDGSLFQAEVSVQRLFEGLPERLDIIRDVSERVSTEQKLSESERWFRQVVECSPFGMHFYELRGSSLVLTAANPAADELLRCTHDDLIGMPIRKAFPWVAGTEIPGVYRRLARKGGKWQGVSVDAAPGKRPRAYEISAFQHSPGKVATIFADVTEKQEAEQRERKYLSRLSAMAAQLTSAEEQERRRIAEDLHDRIGQPLAVARIHLRSACTVEGGVDPGELALATELLEDAIYQTRTITTSLCPPVLYELGLQAALRWLSDELHEHYGLTVHLVCDCDESGVDVGSKVVLFRAAQELALNVVKHSGTTEARMTLGSEDGWFSLCVEDAGVGFSPEVLDTGNDSGFGLFSIKERLPHLGGRFEVHSRRGRGTRVTLQVPATSPG